MELITSNIGASTSVQYLNNLINCYSSCPLKIEYFPDKHGDLYELYGDKEISGVKELVKNESVDEECLELADIECHVCGQELMLMRQEAEQEK